MIQSVIKSVTLNFEETDPDLWRAIEQIEPEERSAFIKEALRLTLLHHSLGERFLTRPVSEDLESGAEISEIAEKPEMPGTIERLEISETPEDTENTEAVESTENAGTTGITGLAVASEDQAPEEDNHLENFSLEDLFTQSDNLAFREEKPAIPKGYQHMLQNIFGLEEDEAVLAVFRGYAQQQRK